MDTQRHAIARASLVASSAAVALWYLLQPQTADLAAQVYRADLFSRAGWVLWDNNWFGGHQVPGYSLLTPWLMAHLGVGVTGVLAALATTLAFAALVRALAPARWLPATAWVAWATVGDLLIGRVTYSVGQALGVLAVLVLVRRGPLVLACALAALSAAASPVAGLFGVIAIGIWWTFDRRLALALTAGSGAAVALVCSALFGDGGTQPYPLSAAALAVAIALVLRRCCAPDALLARRALLVYAAAAAGAWLVPSPMGSNIARLGVAFGPPLAIVALRRGHRVSVVLAALLASAWLVCAPATEIAKTVDAPAATRAQYFAPLLSELTRRGAAGARVEVVPTATRWESVYVGRRFALARGWETQLDRARNALFYAPQLTAGAYIDWLRVNAVRYVALSRAPKERWGQAEEQLLRGGSTGLTAVWRSRDWTLYRVRSPEPLASGARVVAMFPDRVVLDVRRPGPVAVRVRYSRYWYAGPLACVAPRADGFTEVRVRRSGPVVLRATSLRPRSCAQLRR